MEVEAWAAEGFRCVICGVKTLRVSRVSRTRAVLSVIMAPQVVAFSRFWRFLPSHWTEQAQPTGWKRTRRCGVSSAGTRGSIRRRLAYTAARAAAFPRHRRRPRSGSDT